MSAGQPLEHSSLQVDSDTSRLAPLFRAHLEQGLLTAQAAGLDPMVYEANRSNDLQAIYYARGRTLIPPEAPVTNAQTVADSWHGYGLAVDIISREHHWAAPHSWFEALAAYLEAAGLSWGGRWSHPDLPHFQFGGCPASPTFRIKALLQTGGAEAVWRAVGAI